jgi:NADH-quinone oxidoreductase subunit G
MSQDLVNVEVNGVPMQARKGQMIIHVTDANGEYVPRFCYHDKLSVAANCRMCLVEVEKAPKPLPACATPVMEGMKIFTKSPRAIAAQKATMEFLLINHPLDCPICDQGGECELQDLAMGFGRDIARYNDQKRVVKDKNIGPLVSTDMTRCIHCTRCVRFTEEVAGLQALGTLGRGENTEIGTFVEQAVDHELSGNLIDLCPVGALNSKPFRFQGRSWEMTQHAMVSPHDSVGSNLYGHVLRGKLMRVVPRTNEAINETWISDRDRFSYEGIYAADRAQKPMIREHGDWREVDWETALESAVTGLRTVSEQHGAHQIGVLGAPSATVEELYLLARVGRALGTANLDTRLRQRDFRDQAADPLYPALGVGLADVEALDGVLVIGADLRREAPILAHRLRKAALRKVAAAQVAFVNTAALELRHPVAAQVVAPAAALVATLGALLQAAAAMVGQPVPANVAALAAAANPNDTDRAAVAALLSGERRAVWLGAQALRHSAYADLRAAAAALAALTGATLGYVPEGANAAGAALVGFLPHREAGLRALPRPGLDARAMLEARLKSYVLFGGVEPADHLDGATSAVAAADFVVAITPYASEATLDAADVILPIGTFAETSGTFVNLNGTWQSFGGVARPVGEARPGWKVLRVLGNLLGLPGFDYTTSEEVRDEARKAAGADAGNVQVAAYAGTHSPVAGEGGSTVAVPMYAVDAVVRRAPALQRTPEALRGAVAV